VTEEKLIDMITRTFPSEIHKVPNKREQSLIRRFQISSLLCFENETLMQWYSTFFVPVPPDVISFEHCAIQVVGV
jgi:hypothetical protein